MTQQTFKFLYTYFHKPRVKPFMHCTLQYAPYLSIHIRNFWSKIINTIVTIFQCLSHRVLLSGNIITILIVMYMREPIVKFSQIQLMHFIILSNIL